MFVMGRNTNIDLLKDTFIANGVDVDRLLSDNSLIFMENTEWYIPDGKVDKDQNKKSMDRLGEKMRNYWQKRRKSILHDGHFF